MAVDVNEELSGKVLIVHVRDKLTKEDYGHFLPEVERLIKQHGKISILFDMHDFHGWTLSAVWEDIKFDAKHFRDIERLAVIGETKWQEWMTAFCRPFTTARIRYFEHGQADQAHQWLTSE